MTTERRRYPRHELMAQIRVVDGEETYILDVGNISMTGIYILSEDIEQMSWVKLGQKVEMDIFTTDDLENVSVEGLIVRISNQDTEHKKGFGASFTGTSGNSRKKLTQLVAQAEQRTVRPPPLP